MPPAPFIEIRDLSYSYGSAPVLAGVNLVLDGQEFAAVVGPNGGGKTTLLKLVLGLLTPTTGQVRVFGQPPRQARGRIGYMPQHVQVDLSFPVTVMDVVGEREVFDLLQELNRCIPIVVVSHDLGFVSPYVGKVVCVNRQVVTHPTSEVTGEVISQVYGREVRMVRHDHKHDGACSL